jgi:hypothetical protein
MSGRLIILTLMFMLVSALSGQEAPDFASLNQESYRLFLASQWDSVLIYGKKTLRQDVDFYYLRMRMGIARYEKKQYRKAVRHFRKALEFNHGDAAALEYLYYCHLFSGQPGEASLIRAQFRGDQSLSLPKEKPRFLDAVAVEGLYSHAYTDDLAGDPEALPDPGQAGLRYLTRHFLNTSWSLSNRLGPGIWLDHTYTYLSKVNYMQLHDGFAAYIFPEHRVTQHQYYLSPRISLKGSWTLQPMVHLVHIRYQQAVQDGQGYQGGTLQLMESYAQETDVAAGISVRKSTGCLTWQLGIWYTGLNGEEQLQNELGLTWYPLGNLNLYTGFYVNSLTRLSSTEDPVALIPEFKAGFSVRQRVWLDLAASAGEMQNYLEGEGQIVFNSFQEVITKKAVLTASVLLTQKGSLVYAGARWSEHRSEYYAFDPLSAMESEDIYYPSISIFGGITWKF